MKHAVRAWFFLGAPVVLGLAHTAATAQANSKEPAPPAQKCWTIPQAVSAAIGLAADDTAGYFSGSPGTLTAVDVKTGEVIWNSEVGGRISSRIVITDQAVFVASSGEPADTQPGTVRSLSPKTGLTLWQAPLAGADRYSLLETGQGILAVSSKGEIVLLSRADGGIIWRGAASGGNVSEPRVSGGNVIAVSGQNRIEIFDLESGQRRGFSTNLFVPVAADVRDSSVFYSDQNGSVYSSQFNGDQNWKFRTGGKVSYIETVGDKLLIGSADNFVYFLSADYGSVQWKRRLSSRIAHGELIGDDKAIFTTIGERSAFVIDLDNGRVVDQLMLGENDSFLLTPIKANGEYLLVATAAGLSAYSSNCKNEKSGN